MKAVYAMDVFFTSVEILWHVFEALFAFASLGIPPLVNSAAVPVFEIIQFSTPVVQSLYLERSMKYTPEFEPSGDHELDVSFDVGMWLFGDDVP